MAVYQFSQFIEADFITEALYVCPVPEIYFIIVRAVLSFSARTIIIRFSILRYISLQFFILERHGCLFTEACIFLFVSSAFNMAVYQFSQFIEADFITEALYVCPVPEIYFIIVRAVLSFSARTIFIRFSILRYISLQFFILQSIVIICILCGYNRQKCD